MHTNIALPLRYCLLMCLLMACGGANEAKKSSKPTKFTEVWTLKDNSSSKDTLVYDINLVIDKAQMRQENPLWHKGEAKVREVKFYTQDFKRDISRQFCLVIDQNTKRKTCDCAMPPNEVFRPIAEIRKHPDFFYTFTLCSPEQKFEGELGVEITFDNQTTLRKTVLARLEGREPIN